MALPGTGTTQPGRDVPQSAPRRPDTASLSRRGAYQPGRIRAGRGDTPVKVVVTQPGLVTAVLAAGDVV